MSHLDIRWVNEPPVVEIADPEEFRRLCFRFMSEAATWKVLSATCETASWNERIDNLMTIANWCAIGAYGTVNQRFFVYTLLGSPVGLMMTSEKQVRDVMQVKSLATHPGSQNVSGILIEHAVNLSETSGYNGCLELSQYAAPDGEAWGFFMTETSHMKLVPSESDKWVTLGSQWRLKKYRARKTFAGPAEDLLANWRKYIVLSQIHNSSLGVRQHTHLPRRK